MVRRLIALGIVVTLTATLATVAALQSSRDDVEAQVTAYPMDYLCLNYYTGIYSGAFSPSCAPTSRLITLPDDYPITMCASVYTGALSGPRANDTCGPATVRVNLPSSSPITICYNYWTGSLRIPNAYSNGSCRSAEFLVAFPIQTNGDAYATLGNVDIDVPASDGLLANDAGPGLMVTAFDAASANGGAVNVNPDGSFTYIPPAPSPTAFTGADTFTYTVEDSNGFSETVTVTIQVGAPAVWFVDADADPGGDGRRQTPFNDLATLDDSDIDPDQPGDVIFLFEAAAPYNVAFTLEDEQYIVGQEVDLADVLQGAIEGSSLTGGLANEWPPFLVTPAENPGADVPHLAVDAGTLHMADDSTAVGLVISSTVGPAVSNLDDYNALLDRVSVRGGFDSIEDTGGPGIVLDGGSLTILNSTVTGGPNFIDPISYRSGSSLQGPPVDLDGGHAIVVESGDLTVTGSEITGGDGGAEPAGDFERTLQGLLTSGGDGGFGIYIDSIEGVVSVTVNGESIIRGGNGGTGSTDGGFGGHGISPIERGSELFASSSLQGPPPTPDDTPLIIVEGASLVEGGDGGDGGLYGGFGGNGIESLFMPTSVSGGSTIRGGNGGNATDEAGDGGSGIVPGLPLEELLSGSTLQGLPSEFTILTVDGSTVEGGNGGLADEYGGWGGDGIFAFIPDFGEDILSSPSTLQGFEGFPDRLIIDVSASSVITGGNGGEAEDGTGGNGGWGISIEQFISGCCGEPFPEPEIPGVDLDLNVSDSTVTGGAGGAGGDYGGFGGIGITNGFPLLGFGLLNDAVERSPALQGLNFPPVLPGGNLNVTNSTVSGGVGGQGINEEGGFGGLGIVSVGPELLSELGDSTFLGNGDELSTQTTISNSTVNGANGGPGTTGGYGGDAIAVLGVDLLVDQSSVATGGTGADSESDYSGVGGYGINAVLAIVAVDSSTINGGAGGDIGDEGYGGEGIYGYGIHLAVQNNSLITGGDAGSSEYGAIPGGDGIYVEESVATVADSTIFGGNGSFGIGYAGGPGGHGVHIALCDSCNMLTVTNSSVTGGNGGDSDTEEAGDGGEGIIVEYATAAITGSTVTGGNAGTGGPANGAAAILLRFDTGAASHGVIITANTLNAGTGSTAAPSLAAIQSSTGSVCIDATGNTATSSFDLAQSSGTLGIAQASVAAMETANNGVAITTSGTISTNCVLPG